MMQRGQFPVGSDKVRPWCSQFQCCHQMAARLHRARQENSTTNFARLQNFLPPTVMAMQSSAWVGNSMVAGTPGPPRKIQPTGFYTGDELSPPCVLNKERHSVLTGVLRKVINSYP